MRKKVKGIEITIVNKLVRSAAAPFLEIPLASSFS
jgi:hypothetical protein